MFMHHITQAYPTGTSPEPQQNSETGKKYIGSATL
jgi:hypothetical protein